MAGATRDPNEKPRITNLMRRFAKENSLMIVQFICKENADSMLNFVAFVDTVPRVGETVITENKKQCIVRKVAYNMFRESAGDEILLCTQPIVEIDPPND